MIKTALLRLSYVYTKHSGLIIHAVAMMTSLGISPVRQTQVSMITSEANRSTNGFIRVGPFMTTQICLVPKTSNIGCACYVRHRYVADRLANVINLIGDPILGVKKTGSETGSARNSSRLCILCHKSRSFLLVGLCHAIGTSLSALYRA